MAKEKLTGLDRAEITPTRIIGHANPSTGKMAYGPISDLLVLLTAAQAPVKTYANQAALLANTDLGIGYMAYVIDEEAFYLYNGPSAGTIGNYTLVTGSGTTRESGRAADTELLFDKNVIQMGTIVQSGALIITVAESGNLDDQESVIITKIQSNGVDPITVQHDPHPYFNNFTQGEILPEGTYKVLVLRDLAGEVVFSVVKPSIEEQSLNPLTTPASFAAVLGTDPDTEVDLSWTAVPNASSLELQFSTTGGGGPWSTAIPLAGGATSYAATGLTPGTTYHYRLRAVGDGVTYSNSSYAVTAITTQSTGDVGAPTFTFSPADSATDIPVNGVLTITASEALRKADGTELTNANLSTVLTVKQTNSAGADIPYTATIDSGKMEITITPNLVWPSNATVFIEIDGVEDTNGNESAATDITFQTNDYTLASNNWIEFEGAVNTALGAILTADDGEFYLGWTQRSLNLTVQSTLARKWMTNNRSFIMINPAPYTDFSFKFYQDIVPDFQAAAREIIWDDVLDDTEQQIEIRYYGTVDTNNGLDRADLYIDGVLQSGKTLVASEPAWPWDMRATISNLRFGPSMALVKDMYIKTSAGTVTELDIPIMRTGFDVSGNNRHGTWV